MKNQPSGKAGYSPRVGSQWKRRETEGGGKEGNRKAPLLGIIFLLWYPLEGSLLFLTPLQQVAWHHYTATEAGRRREGFCEK